MKRRVAVLLICLLAVSALVFGQSDTFQRLRLSAGSTATLAEVTSVGELLVSTTGTASAAGTDATTFQRVRIAGGATGNLVEVDSTGHLLVSIGASGFWTAAQGGTGITSYAVGDLLYADTTTTLAKLAGVATGQVLASGGVSTAPAYSATPTLTSVTLSGSLLLNNNVPINSKDNVAATQALLSLSASNNIFLGYSGAATLFLIGGTSIDLYPGASPNGRLTSTGLYLGGGVSATDILNVSGQAARIIGSARHTTAATAGNTLTLKAGGAVSGGSNLAGGNLILAPGVSTGSGTSLVNIQAYPGTAGATADNTAVTYLAVSSIGTIPTPPATQTIAATNTITADACGGVKQITAAGAVTTNTTDTFTAPAAGNTGCMMMVCNVGVTNAITLDHNAHFFSVAGADVILLANSCVGVVSDGTQWRQTTAQLTAS